MEEEEKNSDLLVSVLLALVYERMEFFLDYADIVVFMVFSVARDDELLESSSLETSSSALLLGEKDSDDTSMISGSTDCQKCVQSRPRVRKSSAT